MKAKVKKTTNPGSEQADLPRLAGLVKTYAPYDGSFETKVPGVHVFRRSKMNTEKLHVFAQASLCVVAQGAKTVMLDKEVFEYDASKMIVYSLDMPVTIQVTQASFAEPLLGVRVDPGPPKGRRIDPEGLSPRPTAGSGESGDLCGSLGPQDRPSRRPAFGIDPPAGRGPDHRFVGGG